MEPYVRTTESVEAPNEPGKMLTVVEVCYNRLTTTPDAVRELARDICRKENKRMAFTGHHYLNCPLMLWAGANFECR